MDSFNSIDYLKKVNTLVKDPVKLVEFGVFSQKKFETNYTNLCNIVRHLNNDRAKARKIQLEKASGALEKKEYMYKCNTCKTKVNPMECFRCKLPFTHCVCIDPVPNHINRHHIKQCRVCVERTKKEEPEFERFMQHLKDIPKWLMFMRLFLPTLAEDQVRPDVVNRNLERIHEYLKPIWWTNPETKRNRLQEMSKLGISPMILFFLFGHEPRSIIYPMDPNDKVNPAHPVNTSSHTRNLTASALCHLGVAHSKHANNLQLVFYLLHEHFSKDIANPGVLFQMLDWIHPSLCIAFIMYIRVSKMPLRSNVNESTHLWDMKSKKPVLDYTNVTFPSMVKLDAIIVFYTIFFNNTSFSANHLSPYVNEPLLRMLKAESMPTSKHSRSNTKWKKTKFPITDDPESLVNALSTMAKYAVCDLPITFVRLAFRHVQFLKVVHMFAHLHISKCAMEKTRTVINTNTEMLRLLVLMQFMYSDPGKFKIKCQEMIRGAKYFLETHTELWKVYLKKSSPQHDLIRRTLLIQCNFNLKRFEYMKQEVIRLNQKQQQVKKQFENISTVNGVQRSLTTTNEALSHIADPDLRSEPLSEKEEEEKEMPSSEDEEDEEEVFDVPPLSSPPPSPKELTRAQKKAIKDEQTFKKEPVPFCIMEPHVHEFEVLERPKRPKTKKIKLSKEAYSFLSKLRNPKKRMK